MTLEKIYRNLFATYSALRDHRLHLEQEVLCGTEITDGDRAVIAAEYMLDTHLSDLYHFMNQARQGEQA